MRALKFILVLLIFTTTHAQTRVLFIGNSYTGANSLPTIVEDVASSAGYSFSNSSLTPGGATLYQHTQNTATYSAMAAQSWDYIVFQAQSQEPAFPWGQVNYQTLPYADELVDSARSIAPCAQPTFFRTWGRKNGDQWNCAAFPPLCTYEGMDSLLHLRYRMMADSNDAYLSPVGSVWRYIRDTDTTIELYTADESHPSLAGSYAAACTFFTIFTRQDPNTITYDANLDPTTASTIRQATKTVVYDSLLVWNVGKFDPTANLAYTISGDTLTFTSTSTYADSIYIDFGDGNGTSATSGQHYYGLDDIFTITISAFKCGELDTNSYTVQSIIIFGLEEQILPHINHPNQLVQEWPEELLELSILNITGQELWNGRKDQLPPLPNLPTGTYIMQCQWANGQNSSKRFGVLPE
jgi:hypothetical protein